MNNIKGFIESSIGNWNSMRSSHSLAFQHFEQVLSKVRIEKLSKDCDEVIDLVESFSCKSIQIKDPFKVSWESESDWDENEKSADYSIFVPIEKSEENGIILRSTGYSESIRVISRYQFLADGTFKLNSNYSETNSEERILFISDNVRYRTSVIKGNSNNSIIQTSFATEIRKISD
tara:strand:- start:158 stop:685 length:528 start_codon:yes stop_codon:yes gene_type:complete